MRGDLHNGNRALLVAICLAGLLWVGGLMEPDKPGSLPMVGHTAPRSGKWPAVERAYKAEHPKCEVEGCGAAENLNVHHCLPFHKYPKLELDPRNLVTLCSDGSKNNHHLHWGHLGTWTSWNVNIRGWCAHPPTQEEIDKAVKERPR